jgi:hypothetical protein
MQKCASSLAINSEARHPWPETHEKNFKLLHKGVILAQTRNGRSRTLTDPGQMQRPPLQASMETFKQ